VGYKELEKLKEETKRGKQEMEGKRCMEEGEREGGRTR
jgi:hypothetical protein